MTEQVWTQGPATAAGPSGTGERTGLTEPTRPCPAHARQTGRFDPVCASCRLAAREQLDELREQQRGQFYAVPDYEPPLDDDQAAPEPELDDRPRSLLSGMVSGTWLDAQVFPPLEWLVDGILPEGFGLLVAPPKAGKSWMVAGIGLACAAGGYAFGKIVVKQRPVLYLALEDGHRRLQSRFRTLTEGDPIPAEMNVIISARTNEVPGMIAEFLYVHRADKPLVILDTLGKVKPPKQSGQEAYAADYAIGTRLKDLADSVPGACLLAVHHTRKAESPDFVDAVSGTQGIAGSADFILVLNRKRKDNNAVLAVTGRDVVENEYALVTDQGRWALDGMDLADAAATVDRRRDAGNLGDRSMDILAYVIANGPTTPRDIADAFGMESKAASVYLSRLFEAGRITKPKRGTYDRVPTGVESVESVDSDE